MPVNLERHRQSRVKHNYNFGVVMIEKSLLHRGLLGFFPFVDMSFDNYRVFYVY